MSAILAWGWLAMVLLRPLTIQVTPRFAFAPASVRVTVRVQPHPDNSGVYVTASGYRSSFIQLEGDAAPITNYIEWRSVPAGDYVVTASLISNVAILAHATTTLRVVVREE